MEIDTVLIGIQARSTSKRFPGKCFELIGDKRLLDHVIDACKSASGYINRHTAKNATIVRVSLLIPFGDPIEGEFKSRCHIIHGPEDDVLARYKLAADSCDADYIVRITGDCPLIPPWIISKSIRNAIINKYDYVSNSDENCRTSIDGVDCEVMSKKFLDYMNENAKDPTDREHVTAMGRRTPPVWAKTGTSLDPFDFSDIKYSVDTREDLDVVRDQYRRMKNRIAIAERRYGKSSVHRF